MGSTLDTRVDILLLHLMPLAQSKVGLPTFGDPSNCMRSRTGRFAGLMY